MPELPEVENMLKGILAILNSRISNSYYSKKSFRHSAKFPINLDDLMGKIIYKISRLGKYLIFFFNDQSKVIAHAGMSGKFFIVYTKLVNLNIAKHDHIIIEFNNELCLIFHDVRRFGMFLILNDNEFQKYLKHLKGVDALSDKFTLEYLFLILKNNNSPIKTILMNQKYILGIGNIYASEILFSSKIHPSSIGSNIAKYEDLLNKIILHTKDILHRSIILGGSSIKDYVDPNNQQGTFQDHLMVYGRVKHECVICGNFITKFLQQQRSTFCCENCQIFIY